MKVEKGNAMVVMNTTDYEAKMMEHFTTTRCYKKLSKGPSTRITRYSTKTINDSLLDEGIKKKLIPKNPIIPRIYGIPKIHKNGAPLRPIVNTIGSPTYNLAKHLAKTLKPLAGNTTSYIKDSTHFIQEIKNMNLDDNDMLVSFDVVSLYTKVISLE